MAVGTLEPQVARNDVTIKIDAHVAKEAKMVAAARDLTVAEYVSEILRPIVHRDLEQESAKVLGQSAGAGSRGKKPQ